LNVGKFHEQDNILIKEASNSFSKITAGISNAFITWGKTNINHLFNSVVLKIQTNAGGKKKNTLILMLVHLSVPNPVLFTHSSVIHEIDNLILPAN